ncbi:MAG: Holliday junction branch migration protein RuvA [Eubacteriaceae bacterium]|nr:Holliday junction branch migration protein RuvA [Eubacteriaceae bacterium]
MYEYIKGQYEGTRDNAVIVEMTGMGYVINVSLTTLADMPKLHESVKLWLHPVFAENNVALYGFSDEKERELFRTLIGVSGVGPKAAMGILSAFSPGELIGHIVRKDAKAIARAKGIGPKTAERIVLELKNHYKNVDESDLEEIGLHVSATEKMRDADNIYNEAVTGLLGLGYSYQEASRLVDAVIQPGMSLSDVLQRALGAASKL